MSEPYYAKKSPAHKPRFADEVDPWWCFKCETYHKHDSFYHVYVADSPMYGGRSCSLEYSQAKADSLNRRHNTIKELSGGKLLI